MDQTERDALSTFLDEVADLIGDILDEQHEDWFPPRLSRRLRETWESEVAPKIGDVKGAIASRQGEASLEQAGLTGEQLVIKLEAWRHARDAARQGPLSKAPRKRWKPSLSWIGGVLRPLQGALKIADAILESIGSAIPALHGVEEFKKILEGLLDLHDGREPLKKFGSWLRRPFGRS